MINTTLHFIAAVCCLGVAVFALTRDFQSFVHRTFFLGMVILAIESVFNGICASILVSEQAVYWQLWRIMVTALLPGTWLVFALSFGKKDFWPLLNKWKWIVPAFFLPLLIFAGFFQKDFFQGEFIYYPSGWSFNLGWAGYGFYVFFLLSLILIMVILEKTLLASKGRKRWQVKFLVLGIGGYFAFRIYTSSHALVFHNLYVESNVVNAAALLAADLLMMISFLRSGVLKLDIYPSHKFLFSSFTVTAAGIYFIALGLSAKISSRYFPFNLVLLMVFLGLLGLCMMLLSDRMRLKTRQLISRHLRRPQYDYREVWRMFTERTATLVEERAFCESVVKMISEMFDVLSVSVWLVDENRQGFRCAASTALSDIGNQCLSLFLDESSNILKLMNNPSALIDLEEPRAMEMWAMKPSDEDLFMEKRIRYAMSLSAGNDMLGFITLGDRVNNQPMSLEASELLIAIVDQVAAGLLNLKLSERLRQARELAAFQTVSAFFVHDLKNLGSKLSMMLENLPAHFDNPEFRDDALKMMSKNVDQVNVICSRLSMLRDKLEIDPREIDLNRLIIDVLAELNGFSLGDLVENLQDLPKVFADPEQMEKVLLNLMINAGEAVADGGEILVATRLRDGWVELSVKDNGCGMSKEFMDQSLFKPFKTTKTKGIGIGLFQSKMIVEAHNGRIEVESKEGEGSTFRVLLPVKYESELK